MLKHIPKAGSEEQPGSVAETEIIKQNDQYILNALV